MKRVLKFEAEGNGGEIRYGVSYRPDMGSFNDDLGRGGGEHSAYFKTDEGCTYFIQMEELRERCNKIIGTLQSELIYLKTVRGANKNLRDVRAENRRTDEIK